MAMEDAVVADRTSVPVPVEKAWSKKMRNFKVGKGGKKKARKDQGEGEEEDLHMERER